MSGVTVFFHEGEERTFTDTKDCIYKTVVDLGVLSVTETLRLIPGTDGGFKQPRTTNIYPVGVWREVEFCYER